jgi:hypothetical protein
MHHKFLAGLLGAGLVFTTLASAASPKKKQGQMSDDMRRAIAFQRAKDRADARQARLEARHPSVTYNNANSANRSAEEAPAPQQGRRVKDPGEPATRHDKQ